MAFNWNRFAYTNFHELNLDWFSEHFKEIFEEWEELYNTLTQWKEDTDTDLSEWKRDTLADMNQWETELIEALDVWKRETNTDIDEWERNVIEDLSEWKQDFLDAYDTMYNRVNAIVSDTEDMVENLAEPFSSSLPYLKGDYVIYNGILYEFTEDHASGVWTGSDARQTTAMYDLTDIKKAFVERIVRIERTVLSGKAWDYNNNFAERTLIGYYACSFNAEQRTEYIIQARNIGTNTTFAIAFIGENNTVISSITNLPTTADHKATVVTPAGCVLVKFTTNNQSTPPILVQAIKYELPVDNTIVYVAPNGSDTEYDGSKNKPFQTIQKAINSQLADTIIVATGRYSGKISASNLKKLHIIGDPDGGTVIDYTTTISPTTGLSGVKEAAYSSVSTDPIYRVFVTGDLSMSVTSGNVTSYTVNLWTFDGLTKLVPKQTLTEVQNTSNTWTYDGEKIYINSTENNFKLVTGYEDNAADFSGIEELTLENITIKYAGYNNCKIDDCYNVTITACEFSNSGRQHGLAIEDSNATVTKCRALRNCYDGFNIHEQGNTTFIDCEAGYNTDDGLSHHDGATGTVIGGYYHHNTKGAISPTYDAQVNCYNTWCHGNGYGIYYSTATNPTSCIINGCVLSSNNGYGLRVAGNYSITSLGTLYNQNNSNSKADGGGSISSIGGNA